MVVFRDHSSYYYQLLAAAAHRYDEKISVIGNVDPYIIDKDYFHDDVSTTAGVLLSPVPLLCISRLNY